MKHLLITTITAVLLVGCGLSERALRSAALDGNIEAVKRQLAAGANVNAPNTDGVTHLAVAAARGHKEIVEILIANGADVNAEDTAGRTPLHYAAARGHKETAELLIAKGANVNANNSGTPLDSAIAIQYPKIADLLRKHGGKTGEELKAEGK